MSAFDLQKESDVKEYSLGEETKNLITKIDKELVKITGDELHISEKLGIEYRFGCYSEKKAEACHLLGDYLESIKKDFEKASKVYRSNCDDYGYARSCLKYGNYSFLGKGKSGSSGSVAEAYKYYEKGCTLNEPDSCLHSGLILVSRSMKEEVNRDVKKGVQFLTKSCDMNNATTCFYLSGLHIAGIHSDPEKEISVELAAKRDPKEFIVPKDMIKAFNYATKACELRNMYACANLSQMYARGDGTAKSEEKAEKYKKLAIELQDEVKKQRQTLGFQQGT